MNERIEELSRIASEHANDTGLVSPLWNEVFEEKFAELLAQDAISIVQSFRYKMDASNDNIVGALKQHFGVK